MSDGWLNGRWGAACVLVVVCLAGGCGQSEGERPSGAWPVYRGPNRDGISTETGWLARWPEGGPKVLWKTNVGVGYSCVSVRDGRLYTMGNRDNKDTVFCFDAGTGAELWTTPYDCPAGENPGTRATPTLDGNRVYSISRDEQLFCLDAETGGELWSQDLRKTVGGRPPYWGYACSPVVLGRMLILQVGAKDGAVAALDKTDGKLIWKSGEGIGSYSTPTVYEADGKTRLAVFLGDGVVALDAETGEQLWKFPVKAKWNLTITDPIVVDDKVFVSAGYGAGAVLLQVTDGEPKPVWQTVEFSNHYTTSILWKGHLYGIDGDVERKPFLKCYEFATGVEKWSHKGLGKGSLMLADGKLIIMGETGELVVAEASPDGYKELARAKVLTGRCWTMPVLAGGRIYCRSHEGDLVCLDVSRR